MEGDVYTSFFHTVLWELFLCRTESLNPDCHRFKCVLLIHCSKRLHPITNPSNRPNPPGVFPPAHTRFAEEFKKEPNRGYGMAVVNVFKKLLSPKCNDVFEPARAQFNGKGSYGNGGAMRVAGISLVYSDVQDVKKVMERSGLLWVSPAARGVSQEALLTLGFLWQFAKLSAELTHSNSLGYNGAILQALAVHLALQEGLSRETFLEQLISHMEHVEADDKSLSDARA